MKNNEKRSLVLLFLTAISFAIFILSFFSGEFTNYAFFIFVISIFYLISYLSRRNITLIFCYIFYGLVFFATLGILGLPCLFFIILTAIGHSQNIGYLRENKENPHNKTLLSVIRPIVIVIIVILSLGLLIWLFTMPNGSKSKLKNNVTESVKKYMKEKYNITKGKLSNFDIDTCDATPFGGGEYCYSGYVIYIYNGEKIYIYFDDSDHYFPIDHTELTDTYQETQLKNALYEYFMPYFKDLNSIEKIDIIAGNRFPIFITEKTDSYISSTFDRDADSYGLNQYFDGNMNNFKNTIESLNIALTFNEDYIKTASEEIKKIYPLIKQELSEETSLNINLYRGNDNSMYMYINYKEACIYNKNSEKHWQCEEINNSLD